MGGQISQGLQEWAAPVVFMLTVECVLPHTGLLAAFMQGPYPLFWQPRNEAEGVRGSRGLTRLAPAGSCISQCNSNRGHTERTSPEPEENDSGGTEKLSSLTNTSV